jgi:hypothetical protein
MVALLEMGEPPMAQLEPLASVGSLWHTARGATFASASEQATPVDRQQR